ncbi:MAG: tetratricopeptide repeat protein [Candidatus Omnitrophica bacterium]|nr:tetratricopeptide repeat protein [Candidatus Omnitrophota bacterium]
MQKSLRNNLLIIAILILLGSAIYSNTFSSSFHFDDTKSITENPSIRNIHNLKGIWDFWPMRFITYFSIALNFHFHGLRLFGYHLVNLIIHLCSTLLVWWLLLLTFSAPGLKKEKISQKADLIAVFAALIFVAHPLQTQGVTYIIQRAVSLATMFYLLSLCLYIKARLLQQAQEKPIQERFCYSAALLVALLAMFSKEMAITLPFMILLYESYFLKEEKGMPWKKLMPFFATLAVIPLTMWLTKSVDFIQMRRVIEAATVKISPLQYLFTQFHVLATYLRLLFIPVNQNLDYDYPVAKSLMEFPVLASLVLLVLILIFAFRLRARYRLLAFGIFWFFLTLLPESSLIPIKDVIFEHRLYLPMVGFSLFVSSGLFYCFCGKPVKFIILFFSLLVLVYSVKAYNRNALWKNEFTLWNDTVLKSPNKERPYHNRGFAYQAEEKYDQAIADYNKALSIDSAVAETYYNRGNAYRGIKKYDQAIADFDKAIQLDHFHAAAYGGRASAWNSLGDTEKAIADFNSALKIEPNNLKVYNDRGNIYAQQGKYEQAIADYTQALRIDPHDADIYFNRGSAYQSNQDLDRAIADYTKAVNLSPKYAAVYFVLGNLWKDKGELNQAIYNYTRVIQLDPQHRGAYNNRAIAYFLTQQYAKSWEDVYKLRSLGADIHPEILKELKSASGREG